MARETLRRLHQHPAIRPRRSTLQAGAVLLAFALLHGALFWLEGWPSSRRLWGDEIMYRPLAAQLARGQAPELDPLWPPLYVWLLGLVERLGGSPAFLCLTWLLTTAAPRPAQLMLAGLLLGLALLTKSLLLPFVPLLLLPLLVEPRRAGALARAGLVLLLAAAVVTPTLIANGGRHGASTCGWA